MRIARPLILFILVVCSPAYAWTPASMQRIADKGARLAPPDLALLIDKFNNSYHRGLQASATGSERDPRHYFIVSSNRGRLREQLESEIHSAIQMLKTRQPMEPVVEKLGTIAHLVGDANNPFRVADGDSRLGAAEDDYSHYFENRMTTFPTVYYGLDTSFDLGRLLDRTFERNASFYPLLDEEYFRFGERHTSAEFDDRSTAYGIAALCYSHAVTDLSNIYYYIWKQAGGDVRTTPAMKKGNLFLNEVLSR